VSAPSRKRILIVGAGWEQIPLLEAARGSGAWVVATDANSGAPGLGLADERAQLDPRDLLRAVEIARRHRIDAVTADQCDYSRFAAAYLAAMLDLPGFGADSESALAAAQHTTNKRLMRERCRDHRILQPRFVPCRTPRDAHRAFDIIGAPVIVKPVDNRGSFGVHRITNEADLTPAVLDAMMHAHGREVLIEAMIDGLHITVDGCVDQQGVHHNLAVATKSVTEGSRPIITEVLYPGHLEPEMRDHVLETNDRVVEALDIRSGLTHGEYILDDRGRCFLVEMANRGGGVLTSGRIVPVISGVDVSALLVADALALPFPVTPQCSDQWILLSFFIFPPGRIAAIDGLDTARAQPGVLHCSLWVEPGQEVTAPRSGAGRHGFGIVSGDDEPEVRRRFDQMRGAITVRYEERGGWRKIS